MFRHLVQRCTLITLFVALSPMATASDFDDLLKRLPSQSNLLVVMDIASIHESPVAVKEGWKQQHENDYVGGSARIPPTAKKLVVGAQLNPAKLDLTWTIGLLENKDDLNMVQIAKNVRGQLDQISNHQVVAGAPNTFYISLGPTVLGIYRPANRQEVARWLRDSERATQVALSPYLQGAAVHVGQNHHCLIAADVQDLLDLNGVKQRLAKSSAFSGKESDVESLAPVVCGLKGIEFQASFNDSLEGSLRLEFSQDPSALYPFAKQMVSEAMDKMGAKIDDIEAWQVRQEPNTLVLFGPLTKAGLHLIFSPFINTLAASSGSVTGAPADSKLEATLKYYKSLKSLLDDLRKQKAPLSKYGYWYDKYYKAVQELPSLNVDQEMLLVGNSIASALQQLSVASRSTSKTVNVLEKSKGRYMVNYGDPSVSYSGGYYGGYGGGWGYASYDPGQQMVDTTASFALKQNTMLMSLDSFKEKGWTEIDTLMTVARKQMTQKYQVEFP
jgi:hypothetical protein